MKSFVEVLDVREKELVPAKINQENGSVVRPAKFGYPKLELADIFARCLVKMSGMKQNKYLVCRDWRKTEVKDILQVTVNDLTPKVQKVVFTLVYLCAATKDLSRIPSVDEDELATAKNYDIPGGLNLTKVINHSHMIGLNDTLAELDKFILETKIKFEVDKSKILSPTEMKAFYREYGAVGGTDLKTEAYNSNSHKGLKDVAGFYTGEDAKDFEATFVDGGDISIEMAQVLKITGSSLHGFGREQEVFRDEYLINWLIKDK